MIGLGSLIKAMRREKKISVSDMSQGICSERFIYMIENNKNVPSFEIITMFSKKIGANILDYFEYIGFDKPIASKAYVDQMRLLRYKREYKMIQYSTEIIERSLDALKSPLCYEILSNRVVLEIYVNQDLEKARVLLIEGIESMTEYKLDWILNNQYKLENYSFINLFNYLFIYYQIVGNEEKASELLDFLMKSVEALQYRTEFNVLYISISINYYYKQIITVKSEEILEGLMNLLNFQIDCNNLNRIFLTYYLISLYYFNAQLFEESKRYFEKFVAAGTSVGIDLQFKELLKSIDSGFITQICPNGDIKLNVFK